MSETSGTDPLSNRDEYDPYDPNESYLGETREEEAAELDRLRDEYLEEQEAEYRVTGVSMEGTIALRITLHLPQAGWWGSHRDIHRYMTYDYYHKNNHKGEQWLHDNGVTEREIKTFLLYQRLSEEAQDFEAFTFQITF